MVVVVVVGGGGRSRGRGRGRGFNTISNGFFVQRVLPRRVTNITSAIAAFREKKAVTGSEASTLC